MNIREITDNNKFVETIIAFAKGNDITINTADTNNDSIVIEMVCKNVSDAKKSKLINSISDTIITYYDDVIVYGYKITKDKIRVEFSGVPKE